MNFPFELGAIFIEFALIAYFANVYQEQVSEFLEHNPNGSFWILLTYLIISTGLICWISHKMRNRIDEKV